MVYSHMVIDSCFDKVLMSIIQECTPFYHVLTTSAHSSSRVSDRRILSTFELVLLDNDPIHQESLSVGKSLKRNLKASCEIQKKVEI